LRPSVTKPAGSLFRGLFRLRLGLLILLLLVLAPLPAFAQDQVSPPEVRLVIPEPYRISTGDYLEVVYAIRTDVYRAMVVVRTDGMISLPLVDDVRAAGRRLDELSQVLREKYSVVFRNPRFNVILRHSVAARAFVGGEVARGGIISLRQPVTVRQALVMAGGPTSHGALTRVVVMRKKSPTETTFFELDVTNKDAISGEEGVFYLAPGDLVLVPQKNITKIRLWLQQYLYRTLALVLTTEFWIYSQDLTGVANLYP
jgi:polysaccharide export outer membrane protein